MKKIESLFVVLLMMIFIVSCGSVEENPVDESTAEETPEPGAETAFLFATDFASSGQLLTADGALAAELLNTGVTGLGSSAVVRFYGGLLYVLHDGFSVASSDNVQIIDPANGYATVNQWSTGNGTNPQDIVVIGNSAYISLYNPEQDPETVDNSGNPADVIVMNLNTGAIINRISFFDSLNDDGDRLGRAAAMVLADDRLYVCLQDLEADFSHNAAGKVGQINTNSNEVEEVITLQGRNPVDIVYSEADDKLFVALQAPFDFAIGNFDTSLDFGGIEIVDPNGEEDSILVPDEELGGYVEKLVVSTNQVFAIVSEMDPATFAFSSDIMKMPSDSNSADEAEVFITGSSDVREIAADSQGNLWISRRSINATDGSASDPQVDVFNADTGEQVGETMVPTVPVTSIAIGEI